MAAPGGLDHRDLKMEVISRDFLFQARPHLHHPRKTNPFYFELLWEFATTFGNSQFLMMSVLLPSFSNFFSVETSFVALKIIV